MIYKILTTPKFDRSLKKLDKQTQEIIKSWIEKNLSYCEDPRHYGKNLIRHKDAEWRCKIGHYRILAEIKDDECILIFISVGHRSNIY